MGPFTTGRLKRDMVKEEADALPVVGAADGLGERGRHVNDGQLGTPFLLVAERDRVGDDQLGEDRVVDGLDGVSAQDSVWEC